jgi:hypothetical protein
MNTNSIEITHNQDKNNSSMIAFSKNKIMIAFSKNKILKVFNFLRLELKSLNFKKQFPKLSTQRIQLS